VPVVESTLLQAWVAWSPCDCRRGGAPTAPAPARCAECEGSGERPRIWGTLSLVHPVGDAAHCVLDDALD
jgi:hypothetical protein